MNQLDEEVTTAEEAAKLCKAVGLDLAQTALIVNNWNLMVDTGHPRSMTVAKVNWHFNMLKRNRRMEDLAKVLVHELIDFLPQNVTLTAKQRGDLWDASGKNPAGDWRDVIHTRDEEEIHAFFDKESVPRTMEKPKINNNDIVGKKWDARGYLG